MTQRLLPSASTASSSRRSRHAARAECLTEAGPRHCTAGLRVKPERAAAGRVGRSSPTKDVIVGETVWTVKDDAATKSTAITAISKAPGQGLHSPVLTHGRLPVVDGLVTSFDSIDKVRLAQFGLASLIAACKKSGTCTKFRELFLAGDGKYVAKQAA